MQKTSVTFLLDRTGSMGMIKDATIEAFNGFLEGLQQGSAADNTEFTLVQFDSTSIDKIHVNKPVKEVPYLNKDTFQPRHSTPLIAAAYTTIKAVEKAVSSSDKKVVIVIQTDGEENASTQHTWDELNALIKEKTNLGWQFNFLGVGIDAYQQSSQMGISAAHTIATTHDPVQMRAAYAESARNTASFASGVTRNVSFSAAQKFGAGDAYDPGLKKPAAPSVVSRSEARRIAATQSKPKIVDDLDLTK